MSPLTACGGTFGIAAHTDVVSNGLLLRADIHALFDLGLIRIDANSLTVWASSKLDGSEYARLRESELSSQSAPRTSWATTHLTGTGDSSASDSDM